MLTKKVDEFMTNGMTITVSLTVNVPANIPGGEFEWVVDPFQNSLQLLLLGDLWLRHLRHIEFLTFQLFWKPSQAEGITTASHVDEWERASHTDEREHGEPHGGASASEPHGRAIASEPHRLHPSLPVNVGSIWLPFFSPHGHRGRSPWLIPCSRYLRSLDDSW